MSLRLILLRGLGLGVLVAGIGLAALVGYVSWYTGTGRILPGVSVGGVPVGGLTPAQARARLDGTAPRRPRFLIGAIGSTGGKAVARQPEPTHRIAYLRYGGKSWELDLGAVGALPDTGAAVAQAQRLGRSASVLRQTASFLAGLVHGYYVPDAPVPAEALIEQRLQAIAGEVNQAAVDATYQFESDTTTDDAPGLALDVDATAAAVRRALRTGQREIDLVMREVAPAVSKADLTDSRRYQIAHFTTPILAADPGRLQNIAIAVRKIAGVALKPGQVFSFNEVVGPRDAAHGWAQANEIYQGEFVRGYGGGICQVSSTLYNAVLLGGLEVKERYHHDRPLQYVEPGRDATVAWNLLDFKFRNNTDMVLLVGARILPGSPQEIEVTVHAPRQWPSETIRLEAADVQYFPPALEEIPDKTLAPDERDVVDEGHYGIEVKTYRVFRIGDKERRELVSHDKYQPKPGKVRVGVDNAPGNERLLAPGLR